MPSRSSRLAYVDLPDPDGPHMKITLPTPGTVEDDAESSRRSKRRPLMAEPLSKGNLTSRV